MFVFYQYIMHMKIILIDTQHLCIYTPRTSHSIDTNAIYTYLIEWIAYIFAFSWIIHSISFSFVCFNVFAMFLFCFSCFFVPTLCRWNYSAASNENRNKKHKQPSDGVANTTTWEKKIYAIKYNVNICSHYALCVLLCGTSIVYNECDNSCKNGNANHSKFVEWEYKYTTQTESEKFNNKKMMEFCDENSWISI